MLALMLDVPRKYVNEKLDELELEIENLLEDMDEESGEVIGGVAKDSGVLGGNSLPAESVMHRYTQRTLTKVWRFVTLIDSAFLVDF